MLAICGGKGGCGKSTTALGLARALADLDARPLVVDTDTAMPNLHLLADVERRPELTATSADVTALARESARFPGVSVVTADSTDALTSQAGALRDWDGPVILDSPGGASPPAVGPLRAADSAVVVSTPTTASLTDAAKSEAMAVQVGATCLGAVLVRCDDRAECARARDVLASPILGAIPTVDGPALEAAVSQSSYERLARRARERNL
jgi:septum site-determining protein MinD